MDKNLVKSCTITQKTYLIACLMSHYPVVIDNKVFISKDTIFDPYNNVNDFNNVYLKFAGQVPFWTNLPNFVNLFLDSVLHHYECPVKLSTVLAL